AWKEPRAQHGKEIRRSAPTRNGPRLIVARESEVARRKNGRFFEGRLPMKPIFVVWPGHGKSVPRSGAHRTFEGADDTPSREKPVGVSIFQRTQENVIHDGKH